MVIVEGFPERLKQARERAELTQAALAARVEKHVFTISKWEQGLHPPKMPRDYDDLAFALNCSLAWLKDGEGEMGSYGAASGSSDRMVRRSLRRRNLPKLAGIQGEDRTPGGPINWPVLTSCVLLLLEVGPAGLDARDLAKVLPLFYSLSLKSPSSLDRDTAAQILQAIA